MNPHRSISSCSSSSELPVSASTSSWYVELGLHPKTSENGPNSPDPCRSPSVSSGSSPRKLRGARAHIAASKSPEIVQYFINVPTVEEDINRAREATPVSQATPTGDLQLSGEGRELGGILQADRSSLVGESNKDIDMGGDCLLRKSIDGDEVSSELLVSASSSSCDVELGLHPKTQEDGPNSPDPCRSPSASSVGSPRKLRGARAHIAASKSPEIVQYFIHVPTVEEDLYFALEASPVSKATPTGDLQLAGDGRELGGDPQSDRSILVGEFNKDINMGGDCPVKKSDDGDEVPLANNQDDMAKVSPAVIKDIGEVPPVKAIAAEQEESAKKGGRYGIGGTMRAEFLGRIDNILDDELQKTKYWSEEDPLLSGYAAVLANLEKDIIKSLGPKDKPKEPEQRGPEDQTFAETDPGHNGKKQLKSKSTKAVHDLLDKDTAARTTSLPALDPRKVFKRPVTSKPRSKIGRLLPSADKPISKIPVSQYLEPSRKTSSPDALPKVKGQQQNEEIVSRFPPITPAKQNGITNPNRGNEYTGEKRKRKQNATTKSQNTHVERMKLAKLKKEGKVPDSDKESDTTKTGIRKELKKKAVYVQLNCGLRSILYL